MTRLTYNGKTLQFGGNSLIISPISESPIKYGLLYNTYAINDVRLITNTGWHVASVADWDNLTTYLGGMSVAGGKLKETGFEYWDSPNTSATNDVGFNARGTGDGGGDGIGSYGGLNLRANYLTSDAGGRFGNNWGKMISYDNSEIIDVVQSGNANIGYPTRLVKDSTSLSNGETGTYTGNDGKTYNTICINGLEWLSENLAETKWRNGNWIKGYDNGTYTIISDWGTLTEGALCAYNNDPDTYM